MKHTKYSIKKSNKIYKMKGCSKKTLKKYLGGKVVGADYNFAYPYTGQTISNPFFSYTGKGGSSCSNGITPSNLAYPENINSTNPIYPSTGPTSNGFNFLNPQRFQRGGCGCGYQMGGNKHRIGCKCSMCKMKGGIGNNGIPYPNGLVGSAYSNPNNLPGVNHIPGDANYYTNNLYNKGDPQTTMQDIGANPPFTGIPYSIGGKKTKKHKKYHSGGSFSNFLGQDFLNLGRQLGYGIGSAYNAINGYPPPVNPMPWKDQLPNTYDLSIVKKI